MASPSDRSYVAECFWAGVEDEVVLCFFEGSGAAVRRTAELAEIPFERILEAAGSA